MKLTPLHLDILLHHHTNPTQHRYINLPTVVEYHKDLEREGLLIQSKAFESGWTLTNKGEDYIRRVLDEDNINKDDIKITITLPRKEWEKYSFALSDVICWSNGFNAAAKMDNFDSNIISIEELRQLNLKIKGEI